jgi:hypothetical protein
MQELALFSVMLIWKLCLNLWLVFSLVSPKNKNVSAHANECELHSDHLLENKWSGSYFRYYPIFKKIHNALQCTQVSQEEISIFWEITVLALSVILRKKFIWTCVLFRTVSEIELFECTIANLTDKKEILHIVSNIYCSSDKFASLY